MSRRETNRRTTPARPSCLLELALLQEGYLRIAGIDEAGRGCLAGPVVAAAVVFPSTVWNLHQVLNDVRDSKVLSPACRERLYADIVDVALAVGVGIIPAEEVDAGGIVYATRLAMKNAVSALAVTPDYLLVDYLSLPEVALPQRGITFGDSLCTSIAAASIIAKVSRDRLLADLDVIFPGYGFAQHKGYGTPEHLRALARLGPCQLHRRSFEPIRSLLAVAGEAVVTGGGSRGLGIGAALE